MNAIVANPAMSDTLLLVSRLLIVGIWAVAFARVWRFRHVPDGNQIVFGALAMALLHALILFDALPHDVLMFFVAMAHATVAVGLGRVIRNGTFPATALRKPESCECEDECRSAWNCYSSFLSWTALCAAAGIVLQALS
jgi:hypothetical protein